MLLTAVGLPEDMSHPYVLAMTVQVSPKGNCDHDLKVFR